MSSKCTRVALPSKAICDNKANSDSLIALLTPSDNAKTSSITIVKCLKFMIRVTK